MVVQCDVVHTTHERPVPGKTAAATTDRQEFSQAERIYLPEDLPDLSTPASVEILKTLVDEQNDSEDDNDDPKFSLDGTTDSNRRQSTRKKRRPTTYDPTANSEPTFRILSSYESRRPRQARADSLKMSRTLRVRTNLQLKANLIVGRSLMMRLTQRTKKGLQMRENLGMRKGLLVS